MTKVGGITEQLRIARMAEDFGIRYIGHGWNTAVGLAADLHLSAAFPHTDMVEFIGGSPYIDDIVETPWTLDAEGMLEIPQAPGLGLRLKAQGLAELSADPETVALLSEA